MNNHKPATVSSTRFEKSLSATHGWWARFANRCAKSADESLPMSLENDLKLLDWTGRHFRTDKSGVIPDACAPIPDRLN